MGFTRFKFLGNYGRAVVTQIFKRLPVNLRRFFGIKKGHNPKAMGLFLKAYCSLFRKTNEKKYIDKAEYLFNWLSGNYSKGFSGYCWGYNFDWVNPYESLHAYTPSVVVTSFVIDGIYEYFKITNSNNAKEIIISASDYIKNDIPRINIDDGISFSYTHKSTDICYNASLLAAEILAKEDYLNNSVDNLNLVKPAVDFVIKKQKANGAWGYSYDRKNDTEYNQIDFHQGFILNSLYKIKNLYVGKLDYIDVYLKKGINFYAEQQFSQDGRAKWRLPKEYPTDIHNQAQGIITFNLFSEYDSDYKRFAQIIANYTIENFQNKNGYFYYRKGRLIYNKISFIRWAQAWMLLALSEIYE